MQAPDDLPAFPEAYHEAGDDYKAGVEGGDLVSVYELTRSPVEQPVEAHNPDATARRFPAAASAILAALGLLVAVWLQDPTPSALLSGAAAWLLHPVALILGCALLVAALHNATRPLLGRLGDGAGHLHGLDGHVVRWRGSLYMLHHTLGRDAVLCPMYGPGGSMQVPACEVQLEGGHDAGLGRHVVWRTYTFHVSVPRNGRTAAAGAELAALEGGLSVRLELGTVAKRVWTRRPPQPRRSDQQRPRIAGEMLTYREVVTVQFAVPTDDQDEFRLCSWLLMQPPAEVTIAAAARAECPLHGLDFVEGSVAAATPAGG